MTFTPTAWAILVTVVVCAIVMASLDDPRWPRWVRRQVFRIRKEKFRAR